MSDLEDTGSLGKPYVIFPLRLARVFPDFSKYRSTLMASLEGSSNHSEPERTCCIVIAASPILEPSGLRLCKLLRWSCTLIRKAIDRLSTIRTVVHPGRMVP